MRGLSVLFVIMSHGVIWPRIGIHSPGILAVFSAHVGVNVFFALSGFLITMLLIKERSVTGTISLRGFFMRRALRIFPLYLLAITLLLVMDVIGAANIESCAFAFAYSYTLNFAPISCSFSSMSHFWSLAVEEHFYLLWPLIFLLGRRFACVFAVFFAAACVYFAPALQSYFPDHQVWRWTFPAAAPIAFGCLSAFICNSKKIADLFGSKKSSSILLVAIISGLASPAFYNGELVWLLSLSCLILYIFHNQCSLIVRVLEFRPLALLGVISYGLYVWQGFFTGNGPYRMAEQFPPVLDTGLLLTFFAAPLSFLFFEEPILKLKKRYNWDRAEAKAELIAVRY